MMNKEELNNWTVAQIRTYCNENNIKGHSKKTRKANLIDFVVEKLSEAEKYDTINKYKYQITVKDKISTITEQYGLFNYVLIIGRDDGKKELTYYPQFYYEVNEARRIINMIKDYQSQDDWLEYKEVWIEELIKKDNGTVTNSKKKIK